MADLGAIAHSSPLTSYIYEYQTVVTFPTIIPAVLYDDGLQWLEIPPQTAFWSASSSAATFTGNIGNIQGVRQYPWWVIVEERGIFPNTSWTETTNPTAGGYVMFTVGEATGVPVTGQMVGTVKEEGVAVGGKRVMLFYRPTGKLISTALSAADGTFTFTGLEPGSNDYFIVSVNAEPLVYDAVVHDAVIAN